MAILASACRAPLAAAGSGDGDAGGWAVDLGRATDPRFADDAPFAARRAACAFSAGARASETFGPSIAGASLPIDTFVVLIKENRSFDHYFSQLRAYGQPAADVAPADAENPDALGRPVHRSHLPTRCPVDTGHGWGSMHRDYDQGRMDGFAREGEPHPASAMGYFDATDLPFYYGLANTFAIADRYFAPTLTSTGPNRYYLYAGTSAGLTTNQALPPGQPNLLAALAAAGVDWGVYSIERHPGDKAFSFEAGAFPELVSRFPDRFRPYPQFATDAAAGKLPAVVFLRAPGSDEHPPDDVRIGERDTEAIYRALAGSPKWRSTALLLTWDEGGGFYDHVPPPPACAPDAIAPRLGPGDPPGDFARYGFRVPLLVVSAWARPHFVSHSVLDHTAILRLLELRFGLPALTARDANAGSLLELFDFDAPAFALPPELPAVPAAGGC